MRCKHWAERERPSWRDGMRFDNLLACSLALAGDAVVLRIDLKPAAGGKRIGHRSRCRGREIGILASAVGARPRGEGFRRRRRCVLAGACA